MTDTIAAAIPVRDAAQLGPLRTLPGIELCDDGDRLWLRMTDASEALKQSLRSMPAAETFRVLPDLQLVRTGSLLPSGYLPDGPWRRLSDWLQVELPTAAFPGALRDRVSLHLIPDSEYREPNLLLTPLEDWHGYGCHAPQVRLDRWHFAVSSNGNVLIRGLPLPPLPGMRLVEFHGIAVPAGFNIGICSANGRPFAERTATFDVLAPLFKLSPNDVLLWLDDHRREHIPAERFVRATRSAIRNSAEMTHG